MDWPLWVYLMLLSTAFIAGFVSSIAGAGGMIVLPVLLWAGVPPLNALAINKFQSVFGTLSSTLHFFRHGLLDVGAIKFGLLCAFFGAVLGSVLIQSIPTQWLSILLPWLLLLLALYFALSPNLTDEPKSARLSQMQFDGWLGGGLGLYGGFFGPGMGSFYAAAFVHFRGLALRAATAQTKPFVLIVNTTAMLVFIFAGYNWWGLAVMMAAMQFLGARLGAGLVVTQGARLIRPLLILVTLALAIKLLWAQW